MSLTFDCVNCGKQNIIMEDDPYDVKCEFGNHPLRIKEGNLTATINAKDLLPETRIKLGIDKIGTEINLSPIPPKPELTGANIYHKRMALSRYYKVHDSEMLADYESIGCSAAMKRWGCSQSFWLKFRKMHHLPIAEPRVSAKKSPESAGAPENSKPPRQKVFCPEKLCDKCELAIEFRGYRQAIIDLSGARK